MKNIYRIPSIIIVASVLIFIGFNVQGIVCGRNDELHIYENNVKITDNSIYQLIVGDEICLATCHFGSCWTSATKNEEVKFYRNNFKKDIFLYGGSKCASEMSEFTDPDQYRMNLNFPLSDLEYVGSAVVPAPNELEGSEDCITGPYREFKVDIAQGTIQEIKTGRNIPIIIALFLLVTAIIIVIVITLRKRKK